jgi:hypothetical protein
MEVTASDAKAIAASAYIFLLPLVANYASLYREAGDPSSPPDCRGFGEWFHHGRTTNRGGDSVMPHAMSLCSSSWVDLRSEPWVLTSTATASDRIHAGRTTDLWGFVLDEVGDRQGCRVLLAAPRWTGEVPDEVERVVRGESGFVRCEVRMDTRGTGDLAEVRRIRHQFALEPLSAHLGIAPPAPSSPIQWRPFRGGMENGVEFWTIANFALTLTVPHQQDRELLELIAGIGVAAGGRWDPVPFTPHVAEAINDGIDAAITQLMRASAAADPGGLCRSREDTDRDFFGRALCALASGRDQTQSSR